MDTKIQSNVEKATAQDEQAGTPMVSVPGAAMVYNDEPGMAGAEIVTSDGQRISFGGKEAIEQYAEENKLAPEDKKTLLEFDAMAGKHRGARAETDLDAIMASQEAKGASAEMALDPAAMKQVAAARARDTAQARKTLNAVEQNTEKHQQEEANPFGNQVESDEMFTARQDDVKPVVPPEIEKQYLHVGDKFYHLKNTDLIAFEDKGNKLETKADSENIAQSMVRIAVARGWDEIKVSGSESFRKEAWLEAAARGMQVKGYTPSEQDKEALEKRLRESPANKIEKENKPFRARENEQETPPEQSNGEAQQNEHGSGVEVKDPKRARQSAMAEVFAKESATEAVKQYPELAGAAAAVAAMDKKAEAVGLNNEQRAIVSARVRENVVNSIERGNIPEVKIKEDVEVKRETRQEMEAER